MVDRVRGPFFLLHYLKMRFFVIDMWGDGCGEEVHAILFGHTYQWGMSHMWMGHVTHINESCHICEWGMVYRAHGPFFLLHYLKMRFLWLICEEIDWDKDYVYWLRYCFAAHIEESCHMWMRHICIHDPCTCVTWPMHMCDMTHAYVYVCIYPSSICVTWPMHMCDITHAYVWHDSCICMAFLFHSPAMRPPCKAFLRSSAYVRILPVKSK